MGGGGSHLLHLPHLSLPLNALARFLLLQLAHLMHVPFQWLQRLPRRAYPQMVRTGPRCRPVEIHASGHDLACARNVPSVPDRPIHRKGYMYRLQGVWFGCVAFRDSSCHA